MGSLEALVRDFDLLYSMVFNNNNYHFTSMSNCDIKYPVIDQRYNDNEQQIIIAATGAKKDDFEIKLTDDILTIKRINGSEPSDINYKYSKRNISRKKFDIAFKIPKIWDAENLTVGLECGELIVTIPIKEVAKPKVKDFIIK